jgi:hypothetical protein
LSPLAAAATAEEQTMETLVEYAKGLPTTNPARPLIEMFATSSDVMQAIPFDGLTGPVYEGFRQAVLPTVGFRGINEAGTTGTGKVTPFQEPSFIIDHDLDVDRAIVDRYGETRRAREETMAMAAAGKLWLDTFIAGDNPTNPRVFDGLKRRALKFDRTIHNSAASGGAALSLYNLDKLRRKVSQPTHWLASLDLMPRFIQAARNTTISGFVIQSWDEVGKPKMTYAGLPILFGYEPDDHGVILPFTEVASGGGSAVTTSVFCLSLRDGGLKGLQLKPMAFKDMNLLENGITYRTHMSWDCGLVDEHKYCLARLTSITDAAFVA